MALSIIIPVGYDPEGLEITLSSIFKSSDYTGISIDVIVINDGYDFEVEKICKKYKVNHHPSIDNIGPAEGRNRGIGLAKYDYLAFVDADIRVSLDWVRAMYKSLLKYDYVGGKILIDGESGLGLFEVYDSITAFDVQGYMEKGHAPTANLGVRLSVFKKVGLFVANLRSGEDTEFGDRVFSDKSLNFFYCEDALVYHPPRTLKSQIIKRARVIKGHLYLANNYGDRYSFYKKTYTNPLIMLRPPIKDFKKIAALKNTSLPSKFLLFIYAYFLKLFGFYTALSYTMNPTKVKLETKKKP